MCQLTATDHRSFYFCAHWTTDRVWGHDCHAAATAPALIRLRLFNAVADDERWLRAGEGLSAEAGVTLKCLPREKSARGEIITDLICLPLLKYRLPHKNLPIIRPPSEKSPPADSLQAKIPSALAAAGRGGFLPVDCRLGGNFSGASL